MPKKAPEPRISDLPPVGPAPSFMEKLRGKRTGDIYLPSDNPKKKKGVIEQAMDFFKAQGKK